MKREIIENIVNNCQMQTWGEGNRKSTIAFFAVGTPAFDRIVKGVKSNPEVEVVGVLVAERLVRHPESLSVSNGLFLKSTDTHAPQEKHAVVAKRVGQPVNFDSLFAAGKPCDAVVQMVGLGSVQ